MVKRLAVRSAAAIAACVIVVSVASMLREMRDAKYELLEVKATSFKTVFPVTGTIHIENPHIVTTTTRGRIEQVLASEGDLIEQGQIIAWLIPPALEKKLEKARDQGREDELKWSEEFVLVPIVSPSNGQVISLNAIEGSQVDETSMIATIAENLKVTATINEADLTKVFEQQKAEIRADLNSEKITESKIQSIDAENGAYLATFSAALPIRGATDGGMVEINLITEEKASIPTIPLWAAKNAQNLSIDLLVRDPSGHPQARHVKLGASDGEKVEVLENLAANESLMILPSQLQKTWWSFLFPK